MDKHKNYETLTALNYELYEVLLKFKSAQKRFPSGEARWGTHEERLLNEADYLIDRLELLNDDMFLKINEYEELFLKEVKKG